MAPSRPLAEGVYALTFIESKPDPLQQGAAYLHAEVFGQLSPHGPGSSTTWAPVSPPARLSFRLVGDEGRTGLFLIRLAEVLGPERWPSFEKRRIYLDLSELDGQHVACWFQNEGDGLYLVNVAHTRDRELLDRWRSEGALDETARTLEH